MCPQCEFFYAKETSPMYMAKSKTVFVCNECGYESSKWLGKCPACNSWNSFYEQKVVETKSKGISQSDGKIATPQALNSYEAKETIRTHTGFNELDRVLGGGLVKRSLLLLGGERGVGKYVIRLKVMEKSYMFLERNLQNK